MDWYWSVTKVDVNILTTMRCFIGQCKKGDCCLEDGHVDSCHDGNMSEEEYEVERITAEKAVRGGKRKFLVKWKGWPPEDSTWESTAALAGAKEVRAPRVTSPSPSSSPSPSLSSRAPLSPHHPRQVLAAWKREVAAKVVQQRGQTCRLAAAALATPTARGALALAQTTGLKSRALNRSIWAVQPRSLLGL